MRLCATIASVAALTASLLLFTVPSPCEAGRIQDPSARENAERADAVRQAFQASFNDYLKYAEGADELLPLSKKPSGGFGNWGATYIDALTTAHIMGLDDIVAKGIAFAEKVDFANTSQKQISFFETNIRYVASLLSLYEMTGAQNKKLLQQAQQIGDHLLKGFVGDNAIPYNELLDWSQGAKPNTSRKAIIAEAGTIIIEMDRLSKMTGNTVYRDHAQKSMQAVVDSPGILPALYAQGIDPKTNLPTDDYVTWGGGSDSFFEYLVKYGLLIGSCDVWIPTWVMSVKNSIKYLLTRPAGTKANITFLADYSPTNGGLIPQFSHLGCFAGGNWILGGKLLDDDEIVQQGLALADGCAQTYAHSATGIGPEVFVFKANDGSTNQVVINNQTFYEQNGWDYSVTDYVARPEVVESMFYAYRATGDESWQDRAWDAWQAIAKYCKAPAAYAGVANVNSTSTKQLDDSESFLYAELFKYLFLIFDDPAHISLDEYVFNTEAHPFKLEKSPDSLGQECNAADVTGSYGGGRPSPTAAAPPSRPSSTGLAGILHSLGDTGAASAALQGGSNIAAKANKYLAAPMQTGKPMRSKMVAQKTKLLRRI